MRLLFIRHGDPDYENDTLTEKGIRETECLAEYIKEIHIDEIYQSPLGRAKKTLEVALPKTDLTINTLEWLQEFPAQFNPNLSLDASAAYKTELQKDSESGLFKSRILWDILPSYYTAHPELFDRNGWKNSELVKNSNMVEVYENVKRDFLQFLSEHGYDKDGDAFNVEKGNGQTIAFFCHFGITSVLMSILWNISPFIPLQFMAMAPTSITEIVTEEREKGIAIFRALRIGDISHLNMAGETPSFSARFCKQFENADERH
ncbi:histidine phosphatase family protein [Butyrivibrio sp. LC3010]|uniref:histidine phosphatase family protein n=1 Tax=Butyrivibrio sp. LC3010 TaxID=1280680 RepID=UPI00040710D1|nr:histidine phosphatase family protein [Butyrivibrio sp. LC3010]